MIYLVWILCSLYCMYKLIQRAKHMSLDGVIGYTPGLDLIVCIILGPILAVVDISLTWIRLYKEAYDVTKNKEKIF
jgi:hypothetical protein